MRFSEFISCTTTSKPRVASKIFVYLGSRYVYSLYGHVYRMTCGPFLSLAARGCLDVLA